MIHPWDGLEDVLFGASAEEVRRADEEDLRALHACRQTNNPAVTKQPGRRRGVCESDVAGAKHKGTRAQRKKEPSESSLSHSTFVQTSHAAELEEEIDVVGIEETDMVGTEEIDELAGDIDELVNDVDLRPLACPTLRPESKIGSSGASGSLMMTGDRLGLARKPIVHSKKHPFSPSLSSSPTHAFQLVVELPSPSAFKRRRTVQAKPRS
ncbi:hypothetical protein FRC08_013868 [Ceratobasidium sp. 394]|nr:hypothetical protein FRC08_013868 [Ceratobasidium sp. 394]KAG9094179.1 hypothetical protein FS749_012990 [Ceratobasidium sp. UAMH 11750]